MSTETIKKEPELLVNSAHGVYIAQIFCEKYSTYITNMNKVKENFDTCLLGPDNEFYFEAWEILLNNVEFTNDRKEKCTIGNITDDGDLWAIPEGYEYPEY